MLRAAPPAASCVLSPAVPLCQARLPRYTSVVVACHSGTGLSCQPSIVLDSVLPRAVCISVVTARSTGGHETSKMQLGALVQFWGLVDP